MIEFAQSYGLWIALAGVFVAMHWIGKGCCGGGHRHGPVRRPQSASDGRPKTGKTTDETRESNSSCH